MPTKTSPEVLTEVFKRAKRRAAKEGVRLSMRTASEDISVKSHAQGGAASARAKKPDVGALGRWTNPGDRKTWLIPIGRIPQVIEVLGATEKELDELMTARLKELTISDPSHDVVVSGTWIAKRVQQVQALDSVEQVLVDAFRTARPASPWFNLKDEQLEQLSALFEEFARAHMQELSESHEDEPDPPESEEERQAFKQRKEEMLRKLQAKTDEDTEERIRQNNHLPAKKVAKDFLRALGLRQPRFE